MTDDVRLKAVGIDECIDNGGDCRNCAISKRCKDYLASLKDQREAMVPLWRKELIEIWWRRAANDCALQGPFFRPTANGWNLIRAILAYRQGAAA